MGGHDIVVQWYRVGHEFYHTTRRGKRQYLVGANREIPLLGGAMNL